MSEPVAARLRQRLIELPIQLEAAHIVTDSVALASYPGEPRPSSTAHLAGGGTSGQGENVAWTREAHLEFQRLVESQNWQGTSTLGVFHERLARTVTGSYDRAALESAAIDLALRQAHLNLAELAGTDFCELRYVRSFAASLDPLPELYRHIKQAPSIGMKVDVHPHWSARTQRALAAIPSIEVLDFKHQGSTEHQMEIAQALPWPWLEDPGCGSFVVGSGAPAQRLPALLANRFSLDAALTAEHPEETLAALVPAAVNLKVPRMGGVLNLLTAAAFCETRKKPSYMGGMFEVSVGRTQARELASLLAPRGPNDLAPLNLSTNDSFPATLQPRSGAPGFGHR